MSQKQQKQLVGTLVSLAEQNQWQFHQNICAVFCQRLSAGPPQSSVHIFCAFHLLYFVMSISIKVYVVAKALYRIINKSFIS